MARTRGSKPTTKNANDTPVQEPEAKTLSAADSNAPKLFILPKGVSTEARIITLEDPATAHPNRYYFCPEKGFYEFTRIAANKSAPRSWLLASQCDSATRNTEPGAEEDGKNIAGSTSTESSGVLSNGYTFKTADIFVATPFDPIFALLPIIAPSYTQSKASRKQMFLTFDDHVDTAPGVSKHFKTLFRIEHARAKFEDRLRMICDVVEAGEDSLYRVSLEKLGKELLSKATRMVAKGLPASMEERFVSRALQAPVVSVKREETTVAAGTPSTTKSEPASQPAESQLSDSLVEGSQSNSESQRSIATSLTSLSSTTEAIVDVSTNPTPTTSEGVLQLLRIRTALDFMLRSYVSSTLHPSILAALSESKLIDFVPLDVHLKHLESLRADAHALRTMSDNISRKRRVDDDEATEARAEKKRKKEEEEKRKKTESRGLKALRKVDTGGMQKLSSFFSKGPKKETKA
jgi:hypothetical protein